MRRGIASAVASIPSGTYAGNPDTPTPGTAVLTTGARSVETLRFKSRRGVDPTHDTFGMRPEKTAAENSTAMAAALAWSAANGNAPVVLPADRFSHNGFVVGDDQIVEGGGYGATGTRLDYLGASAGVRMGSRSRLKGLRLQGNVAAPVAGSKAIEVIGVGVGPARCSLVDVYCMSHDIGVDLDNTYIWHIVNCALLFNTTAGLRTGTTQTNAIQVHGGEIQLNGKGVALGGYNQISFVGVTIEGNTTHGIHQTGVVHGLSVLGCYFEANGQFDMLWDGDPKGWVVEGCFFGSTPRCFRIAGGAKGGKMQGNYFLPGNTPLSSFDVTGALAGNNIYGPNHYGVLPFDPKLHDAGTKLVEIAPIRQTLRAIATLDFPSIPANSSADLTITVTVAAVGDDAIANPNSAGGVPAGVTWSAFVSAANTVTVRMLNGTTGAIDPPAGNWRARVFQAP